jgi:hypothetical protein
MNAYLVRITWERGRPARRFLKSVGLATGSGRDARAPSGGRPTFRTRDPSHHSANWVTQIGIA